jgi:hypothetical protein
MLFAARKGSRWGLLDSSGVFVVSPRFDRVGEIHSGLVSYQLAGKIGFLEETGREIIPRRFKPELNRMPAFIHGLAAVRQDEGAGFINMAGQWVIPALWHKCWDFVDGRALVESTKGYFVIDKAGEILSSISVYEVPFEAMWPQDWSRFRCLLRVDTRFLTGFVNWTGQIVFPPRFRWMTDFFSDVALFCEDEDDTVGLWGLVSFSGTIVKSPRFCTPSNFSNGLARAGVSKKRVGFIDTCGEWRVEPTYEQACPFSDGLACVTVKGKKGFIDVNGEIVIEPRFDCQTMFHGGVAEVVYLGKRAYIDKLGRVIWEEKNEE